MGLGLAWEQYLERLLPTQRITAERPGELTSPHGFLYSPDLFVFSEGNKVFRVGEIKLTWMSSHEWPRSATNGLPPGFGKWTTQAKLYCHEAQTPYATFYPYFVNGNYRTNSPEFLPLEIEFSARELKENFQTLMQHARNERLL